MNLSQKISLFEKVGTLEKLLFTKHLAVMIKSGIPLSEALESISTQTQNDKFKSMVEDISKSVAGGHKLSEALRSFPKLFDSLYVSLIAIGEESGTLEDSLEYLSDHVKKINDFKRKVQAAMLYPSIVLITTIVVGAGISFFVLPQLINLFESLDVKLPLSTQILLNIAYLFRNHGILILIVLVLLFIAFRLLIATSLVKPHWHYFLLRLPVFGAFLQHVRLAYICRNLGVTLKGGLPIDSSLKTIRDSESNLVYRMYLTQMLEAVSKGKTIESELSKPKFEFIPKVMAKMIGVGEKSGKLEESLIYLAEFFEEDVDYTSKNLANILEPIVLLLVGIAVAFVAISIISPIYKLTGSIKR